MSLPFFLDTPDTDDDAGALTGYTLILRHTADFSRGGEMAAIQGDVELDDGTIVPVTAWMSSATYADIAWSSLQALEALPDDLDEEGHVAPRLSVLAKLEITATPGTPNVLIVIRALAIDVCLETAVGCELVEQHPILAMPA